MAYIKLTFPFDVGYIFLIWVLEVIKVIAPPSQLHWLKRHSMNYNQGGTKRQPLTRTDLLHIGHDK